MNRYERSQPNRPNGPPPNERPPRQPSSIRILSEKEVIERVGLKRAQIDRMVNEGTFPKPISLTDVKGGRKGWFEHEIDEWLLNRPRVERRRTG